MVCSEAGAVMGTDGRAYAAATKDYGEVADLEPWVKAIDIVDRTAYGELMISVIWNEDDSYMWVSADIARKKCPQKVLDFYQRYLSFTN